MKKGTGNNSNRKTKSSSSNNPDPGPSRDPNNNNNPISKDDRKKKNTESVDESFNKKDSFNELDKLIKQLKDNINQAKDSRDKALSKERTDLNQEMHKSN